MIYSRSIHANKALNIRTGVTYVLCSYLTDYSARVHEWPLLD